MTVVAHIAVGDVEQGDNPFFVHCPTCQHAWIAAYLPMRMDRLAALAKGVKCPRGCDSRVLCGVSPKGQPDA